MNNLEKYADVFADVRPWAGQVPSGYLVDFVGTLTDATFRQAAGADPSTAGGCYVETKPPTITDGEEWFEAVDWFEAAREARERYVMVTLGACYGAQAVGSYRALQLVNAMPYKLVAVEPEPENYQWVRRHMRDNSIDPDQQWLVKSAISASNDPVYFPVGSPGSGAQNCFSTNEQLSRKVYVQEILQSGRVQEALENLILHNTTGLTKDLVPGLNFMAEIKLMSAVTLRDILSPFDVVDYVESDIQQSEIVVFPPYIDLLSKKVRRIHIGTHGVDVHRELHDLFAKNGWEIIFSYEPNGSYSSALGSFTTNDGVLTVRNLDLA